MSWLQAAHYSSGTGDGQHHDGEVKGNTHIHYIYPYICICRYTCIYMHAESTNGHHICIVIPMYIAIVILCLPWDFRILLYHSSRSKSYAMLNTSTKYSDIEHKNLLGWTMHFQLNTLTVIPLWRKSGYLHHGGGSRFSPGDKDSPANSQYHNRQIHWGGVCWLLGQAAPCQPGAEWKINGGGITHTSCNLSYKIYCLRHFEEILACRLGWADTKSPWFYKTDKLSELDPHISHAGIYSHPQGSQKRCGWSFMWWMY